MVVVVAVLLLPMAQLQILLSWSLLLLLLILFVLVATMVATVVLSAMENPVTYTRTGLQMTKKMVPAAGRTGDGDDDDDDDFGDNGHDDDHPGDRAPISAEMICRYTERVKLQDSCIPIRSMVVPLLGFICRVL